MRQEILGALSRNWWVLIIYGVIAILFSIAALTAPLSTAISVAWAIGLFALLEGVITIVSLLTNRIVVSKGWLFGYGVISIIFGVLALYNPAATASILMIFLAVWLIIGGIYRILFAIQVRNQIQGEWMIILSGVLAIILGALLMAQPIVGLVITTIWLGAIVLMYGILQIYAGVKLRGIGQHQS